MTRAKRTTKSIMVLKNLIDKHGHNSVKEFSKKIHYSPEYIYTVLKYYDEIPEKLAIRIIFYIDSSLKITDLCPSLNNLKKR